MGREQPPRHRGAGAGPCAQAAARDGQTDRQTGWSRSPRRRRRRIQAAASPHRQRAGGRSLSIEGRRSQSKPILAVSLGARPIGAHGGGAVRRGPARGGSRAPRTSAALRPRPDRDRGRDRRVRTVSGTARQRLPRSSPASRCGGRSGGAGGRGRGGGGGGRERRRLRAPRGRPGGGAPLTAVSPPRSSGPDGRAPPRVGAQVRRQVRAGAPRSIPRRRGGAVPGAAVRGGGGGSCRGPAAERGRARRCLLLTERRNAM